MSEPKYDEDLVNLGYLKRVISDTEEGINIDFKNVSRHYGSQPIPPYYEGDTWVDGNIVYTCINTRLVGSYTASDWVTESGALQRADNKSKVFLTQPSNYKPGDMWILQSDNDHRAGKKGEILITTAGRAVYDSDDWVNMLGYGTIRSINEVADNLNNAITRIGVVEEAIEDGIIITFYQAEEPEGVHIGDLWYVTGEVTGYTEGKIYRYNGSTWDLLDDPAIQEAFDEANNARLVADGKIQSFYSASEPTSGDIGVGDLWIDTDDNNKLYRYNGTNWVACYDTRIDDMVETVEETTERVTTIETDLGEIDLTVKETTTKVTTIEGQLETLQDVDGQAEGKYIYLDDASDELITSAKFNGETSQATRSGKNIIPMLSFDTMGNNGTGFTYDASNHRITYSNENNSGRGVYHFFDNFVVGTTYTLSFDIRGTAGKVVKIGWNKNTQDYTLKASYERVSYPFTVPTTREAIVFYTAALSSGGLTTNEYMEFDNVMITTDGSTDYEEYGVMPSPDYPSEIENVKGKNLLKSIDSSQTINGITFTLNEDKSITVNGTATANALITVYGEWNGTTIYQKLNPDKYYTISGSTNSNIQIFTRITNGSTITSHTPQSNPTFSGKKGIVNYFIQVLSGAVCDNITIKPQLEEGSKATSYVPYNSLEVKAINKNLFNEEQLLEANNWTKNNEGFYTGTIGNLHLMYSSNNGGFKFPFKFKENTQYTLSLEAYSTLGNNNSRFQFVYTDGTISSPGNFNYTTSHKISGKSIAGKTIKNISTNYSNTGSDVIYIKNIQLEENEPTDYEGYKEQIVYFPLAEGQKLYEGSYLADDGIHNVRGQIVYDGSSDENWGTHSYGTNSYQITNAGMLYDNNEIVTICDYFKGCKQADRSSSGNNIIYGIDGNAIVIRNTTLSSLSNLKTWLQSNPITVEYKLAEEEIIPYNTEQQAAWNKIKELHTYKTVTHIYSDAYAGIGYIKDNGLDIYETKASANLKYTETTEKFAQQKITNESIENTVSQTVTTVANNYNELKTKFDDYAPKSDVITLQTSVNQIMTDTYTKTEINEKLTDGSVTKVSTTAGTFDSNGLTIEKTDAKTKGNFNHEGIKVMDTTSGSNQELLFAGYDEEINETIVRTNNLTVNKYFTLKNVSRQEKYVNPVLGGKGIGTFIL